MVKDASLHRDVVLFEGSIYTSQVTTRSSAFALDMNTKRLARWFPVSNTRSEWLDVCGVCDGSPTDTMLLYNTRKDTVTLISGDGDQHTLPADPQWRDLYTFFSPGRELVATVSETITGSTLRVQTVHDFTVRWELGPETCKYIATFFVRFPVRWSPNGEYLAFVANTSTANFSDDNSATLYVVRRDGTELRAYTPVLSSTLSSLTWSPQSDKLAFGQAYPGYTYDRGYTQLWLADIHQTVLQPILPPLREGWVMYRDIAWSPNGEQLAFVLGGIMEAKRETPLWIVDVATQDARLLLLPNSAEEYWYDIQRVTWAPGDYPLIAASLKEDETLLCRDTHGSNDRRLCTRNLFAVDPNTGVLTQLTQRRFYEIGQLTWLK